MIWSCQRLVEKALEAWLGEDSGGEGEKQEMTEAGKHTEKDKDKAKEELKACWT